jgi:hypothetical protein
MVREESSGVQSHWMPDQVRHDDLPSVIPDVHRTRIRNPATFKVAGCPIKPGMTTAHHRAPFTFTALNASFTFATVAMFCQCFNATAARSFPSLGSTSRVNFAARSADDSGLSSCPGGSTHRDTTRA